ncbi:hypothetical protein [Cupriavidus sp. USMAHM13]|uniref:hypothetical protein n=1 Tax=Cupriavidus sp. USMAHM13 TaxID=1389192 RepID=UPI0012EA3AAC|nr:hypothetical protein [Cupriavidus sp. USMAHM13]
MPDRLDGRHHRQRRSIQLRGDTEHLILADVDDVDDQAFRSAHGIHMSRNATYLVGLARQALPDGHDVQGAALRLHGQSLRDVHKGSVEGLGGRFSV